MKHDKTFEAIAKLKDIEWELHRLKNALEIANKALDAYEKKREWVGLIHDEVPAQYKSDSVFVEGWLWAEAKLREKNGGNS